MSDDDIIDLLNKLKNSPYAKLTDFFRYLLEYFTINMDKLEALNEGSKVIAETLPQFSEGKIPFEEMLLLICPALRDAIKYTFRKMIEESDQYNSPEIR